MAPTFQPGNWGFVTWGGHLAGRRGGLRAGQVRADPGREGWGGQGLEGRGGGGEGEQGTPASRLELGGSLGGSQGGRGPAAQFWGPHEERPSGPRPKSQGSPPRQARASCQDQLPPKPLAGRLSSRGSHSTRGRGRMTQAAGALSRPPGPLRCPRHLQAPGPCIATMGELCRRPTSHAEPTCWPLGPGRLCMTGPAVPARCPSDPQMPLP